MQSAIESSISSPVVLCNIISQYAKSRVERYLEKYIDDIIYVHMGVAYEMDEETVICTGVDSYSDDNLTNRLGLGDSGSVINIAIMSTSTRDLLLVVNECLLVYEILPDCRYNLLNKVDLKLFAGEVPYDEYLERYNKYMSKYNDEPEPPSSNNTYTYVDEPNSMYTYNDKLILCFENIVQIYNFDSNYELVLINKFNTIGGVVTAYMYIVSSDNAAFYIYDLDGVLLRHVDLDTRYTNHFIIDDDKILRYKCNHINYMIDLSADVPLVRLVDNADNAVDANDDNGEVDDGDNDGK
jgi:hypothetical protein